MERYRLLPVQHIHTHTHTHPSTEWELGSKKKQVASAQTASQELRSRKKRFFLKRLSSMFKPTTTHNSHTHMFSLKQPTNPTIGVYVCTGYCIKNRFRIPHIRSAESSTTMRICETHISCVQCCCADKARLLMAETNNNKQPTNRHKHTHTPLDAAAKAKPTVCLLLLLREPRDSTLRLCSHLRLGVVPSSKEHKKTHNTR